MNFQLYKAKKSAEEIKKQEEERLRIQKELNEYHNKIYDDIEDAYNDI